MPSIHLLSVSSPAHPSRSLMLCTFTNHQIWLPLKDGILALFQFVQRSPYIFASSYVIYLTFSSSTLVGQKPVHFFLKKSPNKCQKRVNYPFSFLLTLVPSQSPIYPSICAHLSIRIKSFFLHTVSHQKLLSVYPQKIPFSFIVQLTLGAYPLISSSPSLVLRCPPFCSHSLYYPSVLWTV